MAQPVVSNSRRLSILSRDPGSLSDEDARIVRGLRAGVEVAYEELIERFEHPLYALMYRLVGNQDDASDLVQEVFVKVFRGVNSFREQCSLRTWIYRIAVNEVRNHRRWSFRHKRNEIPIEKGLADADHAPDCPRDTGRSPYDCALEKENRSLIDQALSRVKPNFRLAVILRDIDNLSYEEIAHVMQVSLGTVKSRILRGRECLRKELTERLERTVVEAFTYGN